MLKSRYFLRLPSKVSKTFTPPPVVSRALSSNNDKSGSVTLTTLAEKIAEAHDLSKAESRRIVTSVFDQVSEAVANKKKVSISNFGSFESIRAESRVGRNPQTGQPMHIAAKERIRFKPFTHLKEPINK